MKTKSTEEITIIEKQLSPIIEQARELKIEDGKDMPVAVEILSRLNQFVDKITGEKERITKPLLLALKNERSRWNPLEKAYEGAIDIVREKMSQYQTQMIKKQREEEKKIAARVGEGRGKIKLETAVRKMDEIEKPDQKVVSTAGVVSFREVKKLKIVDESLIPRQYLIVDESAVLEALKAGIDVPGAEIELVQNAANYR